MAILAFLKGYYYLFDDCTFRELASGPHAKVNNTRFQEKGLVNSQKRIFQCRRQNLVQKNARKPHSLPILKIGCTLIMKTSSILMMYFVLKLNRLKVFTEICIIYHEAQNW